MNRLIILSLFLLTATLGFAQRYVINIGSNDGKTDRVEARRVDRITLAADDDSITAFMADGTAQAWAESDLYSMKFEALPQRLVHYTQSIENDYVHRFISEVLYDPDDYEYSQVLDYADHSLPLDQPRPMVIRIERGQRQGNEYVLVGKDKWFRDAKREELTADSLLIWNMTPGDSLYYRIMEADGKTIVQEGIANATGQVRMIYAPSVNNIRDMGGWPLVGGGHIRYGRLYRGAKFHDANNHYLSTEDSIRLRELNIKCEFDLRGGTEAGGGLTSNYYSRLGRDIDYRINGHGMYAYYNAVAVYPEYFRYGWNMVKAHIFNGDPIFVHCSHGCDRMGTWAMVIEGVLGVCENDLNLDYELSAFAPKASLWRYRNMHLYTPDYDFRNTIGYIKSLPGETLKDKFEYFLVTLCKIPKSDIERLRECLTVKD